MLPKMAPEAVFIDFLRHLRSKSHSRSILGGSEPSKLYYFHSGSTIFTKSRFSLFPRILTPNGTPKPRIFTKNARGGTSKSPTHSKKVVLWSIKSGIKFWTEKNSKKKELEPSGWRWGRVAGTMYNVGGRVRKGKPFQLGTNFGHGFRDAGHRGGGFNRYAHSAVPS